MKLDRVILASDADPLFLNFWPIAAKSWEKVFGITPSLALISRAPIGEEILARLRIHGNVHYEVSLSQAPIANQAKMFRWFLASKFESEIVTIEDIDTIYLKSDYLENRLSNYRPGKLLGIGHDVAQDDPTYKGKFPASNLTGSGFDFQRFFKTSQNESFEDFLLRFKGLRIHDDRENPFNKAKNFSDESLIRALRSTHSEDCIETIAREVDIKEAWMDRSWWPQDGKIPKAAILANMPRPLFNNKEKCRELIFQHFPDNYPWIFTRKSRFWENPDGKFLKRIEMIRYHLNTRKNISSRLRRDVNDLQIRIKETNSDS